MAKKKAKMSLKKKIAAAIAGAALIVAAALGIKHVRDGMAKYEVGTCLVSEKQGVVFVVTGISEDKYKMVVLLMGQIPVAQIEAPIRLVNKDDLPAFECKTGKPLNKQAEDMQKGGQGEQSEEQQDK